MIKNLKKQLQEQKVTMTAELQEQLKAVFKEYELKIDLDDDINAVSIVATQEIKENETKTISNLVNFYYNREKQQSYFSTLSTSNYTDSYGIQIGFSAHPLTLTLELTSFVFSLLMQFINTNNPIEEVKSEPTE